MQAIMERKIHHEFYWEGLSTIDILDHRGEFKTYAVTVLDIADLCFRLTHAEKEVIVHQAASGKWQCDCEDFRFRRAPAGQLCKHCLAVASKVEAMLKDDRKRPPVIVPMPKPRKPAA